MLLHPQAHAAARWWRWARATGLMGAVVFEPRVAEPWTIAEGVDIALCAGEARAPHASLDRACRRAAVGVLPLMEFMAAGVPVIAEAVPPATELFVDGRSGLLVPLDDRVAVARALLRLHDDPEFRRRLGLEGQAAMRRLAEPQGFAARLREALGPLAASDQSAMKASAASR